MSFKYIHVHYVHSEKKERVEKAQSQPLTAAARHRAQLRRRTPNKLDGISFSAWKEKSMDYSNCCALKIKKYHKIQQMAS